MEVYLDGRALDSREALHQALSALLAFPAYYGKNLDALHDCLTDLSDPVHLTVLHAQALDIRADLSGLDDLLMHLVYTKKYARQKG